MLESKIDHSTNIPMKSENDVINVVNSDMKDNDNEDIKDVMKRVRNERKNKNNENDEFLFNVSVFAILSLVSIGFGYAGFKYGMNHQIKKIDQDINFLTNSLDSDSSSSSSNTNNSSSGKSFTLKFKNQSPSSINNNIAVANNANKQIAQNNNITNKQVIQSSNASISQKESIKFPSRNKAAIDPIFPKKQLKSGMTPLQVANRALFLGTALCFSSIFVGTGKM